MPDVRRKFADLGMETIGKLAVEFAEVIKAEIPVWPRWSGVRRKATEVRAHSINRVRERRPKSQKVNRVG